MKARAKIITAWYGNPPAFYDKFLERIRASTIVDYELVKVDGKRELNSLAERCTGVPCRKATDYAAACDLKPLYGEMFADRFAGYEWWGRCDLDVVMGDLDGLLPPLLDYYDVISAECYVLSGALTLFRNTLEICGLYRRGEYQKMLDSVDYTHFDHGCNTAIKRDADWITDRWSEEKNNPSLYGPPRSVYLHTPGGFTGAVMESGLKTWWDDRSWDEGRVMLPDGRPSRVPHLVGKKLIEMPTGRELLLYSLGSAQWPFSEVSRKVFNL